VCIVGDVFGCGGSSVFISDGGFVFDVLGFWILNFGF
jgi:hypothetical protein